MKKEIFLELIEHTRALAKAAEKEDEKGYIYVTKKLINKDCFDVMTFGALLESKDFPASYRMSNDALFDAFLIWKEGYGRGMYSSATYIKDFINEIRLPEKLQTQCVNAAFMEYGLRLLIPETKVLYGKLAYIAAFEDESKIVSGFNIKKSELENLSGSIGLRFKTAFADLQDTGYIVVENVKKRKNVFKIFVKITDEYIENMGEYDTYFSNDEDEPWVIVGEWESKESINKKINEFKKHYGFDPLIHILKMPNKLKESVSEIDNP